MKLSWNSWNWGIIRLNSVVGLINHSFMKMLVLYLFDAFIFCLEIIALGYRWRIVLIVVDTVCWLGKTETNHVEYVIEYDGWNNTSNMCIDWSLYMISVYIHCIVWEEIGDVLHGLEGHRGWTPKPDIIWEEIGDGLHWYSKSVYHIWSMEVF